MNSIGLSAILIVLLDLSGSQWQHLGISPNAILPRENHHRTTRSGARGHRRSAGPRGDAIFQKYFPVTRPSFTSSWPAAADFERQTNVCGRQARGGLPSRSVSSGMLGSAILGGAGVKYQFEKFHYLGASDAGGHYVFCTRKEAGANN